MRLLLIAALLGLGACATPDPTATPDPETPDADVTPDGEEISEPFFDSEAWIAEVEATDDPGLLTSLSADLLDAVDWRTACGEDDPTATGRGLVQIHHLDADVALAEITCQQFAYQSTFALVDARSGRPPRLIRSLGVTEAGEVATDTTASFFGLVTPADDDPPRFDVLTKSAGHGGCGTETRYALQPDGGAAILRIRAHADCDAPLAPEAWPVTVSR